jgi:hypothetical protein
MLCLRISERNGWPSFRGAGHGRGGGRIRRAAHVDDRDGRRGRGVGAGGEHDEQRKRAHATGTLGAGGHFRRRSTALQLDEVRRDRVNVT